MESKNLPLIILNNPLIFMDETYLKNQLLKDKYSKGEIVIISQNEIIIKAIIKFSDESLIDQFISDFNEKPLSEQLDYKLSLSKETKSEEEVKKRV